ncbi:DUF444 family protein [bacterium]|nr:DUF444 family protein [bacterium]
MSVIIVSDEEATQGPEDAKWHRDKQIDDIKERIPDIITNEDIITSDPTGKKIVIPIRILEVPDFRHGNRKGEKGNAGGYGIGAGRGSPGDIIGREKRKEKGSKAGDGLSSGMTEAEIDFDELLISWAELIGLPNIRRRSDGTIYEMEWRIGGTTDSGPISLLKHKDTGAEACKIFFAFMQILQNETGEDELTCYNALKESEGGLNEARDLLEKGMTELKYTEVEPFLIYADGHLLFNEMLEKEIPVTTAVILFALDVSYSMDRDRKFIAISLLFWIRHLLRVHPRYKRIIVRCIIHPGTHEKAEIVSAEEAFARVGSGGTEIYAAFEVMNQLVEAEYPTGHYDVYGLYCSDGEDFDIPHTIEEIRKFVTRDISMLGYAEVRVGGSEEKTIMPELVKAFDLRMEAHGGISVSAGSKELPLIAITLHDKAGVGPAIAQFLQKERWS